MFSSESITRFFGSNRSSCRCGFRLCHSLRGPFHPLAAATQRAIPAKGQVSLLLRQIFPNVNGSGWLSLDVDLDQVSGFWLGGDFVNSTDGAPLVNSRSAVPLPAFAYITSKSEISFVNTGSSGVSGFLSLH